MLYVTLCVQCTGCMSDTHLILMCHQKYLAEAFSSGSHQFTSIVANTAGNHTCQCPTLACLNIDRYASYWQATWRVTGRFAGVMQACTLPQLLFTVFNFQKSKTGHSAFQEVSDYTDSFMFPPADILDHHC